jgi:hypothetical protein
VQAYTKSSVPGRSQSSQTTAVWEWSWHRRITNFTFSLRSAFAGFPHKAGLVSLSLSSFRRECGEKKETFMFLKAFLEKHMSFLKSIFQNRLEIILESI